MYLQEAQGLAQLKQSLGEEAPAADSAALMALAAAKAAEANTQLHCGQCCACSGILVGLLLAGQQLGRTALSMIASQTAGSHPHLACNNIKPPGVSSVVLVQQHHLKWCSGDPRSPSTASRAPLRGAWS